MYFRDKITLKEVMLLRSKDVLHAFAFKRCTAATACHKADLIKV